MNRRKGVGMVFVVSVLVGLVCVHGLPSRGEEAARASITAGQLQVYLGGCVRPELLAAIAQKGEREPGQGFVLDATACESLDAWAGRPIAVKKYDVDGQEVLIRLEDDYLILWVHASGPLVRTSSPAETIRRVCRTYLSDAIEFPSEEGHQFVTAPRRLDGSQALVCSFWRRHISQAAAVSDVSVLVKGQDAVFVLEKAKKRHPGTRKDYSGLATDGGLVSVRILGIMEARQVPAEVLNACVWQR